jgi:serine/threonine-protein kinase HipA
MPKSPDELKVLLGNQVIGSVFQPAGGYREFRYIEDWENVATPLSLSMPPRKAAYNHIQIDPFMWGLIPDNVETREQLGIRYNVSYRNPMAILSKIGRDCAGAVQFCTPAQTGEVLKGKGELIPLSDADIAGRLKVLNAGTVSTIPSTLESWSLAGNQTKMAVRLENERWYMATGAEATSHILKPGIQSLDSQAASEYVTMRLAAKIGVPSASVRYLEFKGEPAICVERYDRLRTDTGRLLRVHQEDMCQVFSVDPADKYPKDGGPTADMILDKLALVGPPNMRNKNREDFVRALFFNYLTASPDAHGKNYSVLLLGNSVRLAPIYDTASGIHYIENGELRYKHAAMRIGGENKFGNLRRRHIENFAMRNNFSEEWVAQQFDQMITAIPGAAEEIFDENKTIPAVYKLRKSMLGALNKYCAQIVIDLRLNE